MFPVYPLALPISGSAWASYGSLNRAPASSPPISSPEPLDLLDVKDYLKLPIRVPPDSAEDVTLSGMIPAAREMAEILQGRDLVRKQWDLSRDYWPVYSIQLRPPVVSVDLVQYRDSEGSVHQLAADTDYVVDTAKQPGIILPAFNKTWPTFTPWPSSAILVRFTSGLAADDPFWSDAGARVKIGMKRLILDWFLNRIPQGTPAEDLPYAIKAALSYGGLLRAC